MHLAAAACDGAALLVTNNTKDFKPAVPPSRSDQTNNRDGGRVLLLVAGRRIRRRHRQRDQLDDLSQSTPTSDMGRNDATASNGRSVAIREPARRLGETGHLTTGTNLTIGSHGNVQLARNSVLSISAAARSQAGIDAAYTFRVVDERA